MIVFAILPFVVGIALIIFTEKIYKVSWYAKKDLTKYEIKMFFISYRVVGVAFIIFGIFMLLKYIEISNM